MTDGPGQAVGSGAATERLEATVRGRVQGVGYRFFVVRRAQDLGLTGWVANTADGSVQLVAEGSPVALDRLADDLRQGPMGAIVDALDAVRMPATGRFSGFSIRSGAHGGD